eukprot:4947675-Pyramimonas_sp.AAC.1
MVGVRAWSPGNAADALHDILKNGFHGHLMHGGWNYPSVDMKRGIDIEAMSKFSEELHCMIKLDPRGGHFLQKDFEIAVKRLAVVPENIEMFRGYMQMKNYESTDHTVTNITYQYRVMLSHIREKYDGWCKLEESKKIAAPSHPAWLQSIYESIIGVEFDAPSAGQYPRRPHPLFAFRTDDDPSEMAVCVYKQLEVTDVGAKAFMLMSDGAKLYATKYIGGDNGMAVALWDDVERWPTSIPNGHIANDG